MQKGPGKIPNSVSYILSEAEFGSDLGSIIGFQKMSSAEDLDFLSHVYDILKWWVSFITAVHSHEIVIFSIDQGTDA